MRVSIRLMHFYLSSVFAHYSGPPSLPNRCLRDTISCQLQMIIIGILLYVSQIVLGMLQTVPDMLRMLLGLMVMCRVMAPALQAFSVRGVMMLKSRRWIDSWTDGQISGLVIRIGTFAPLCSIHVGCFPHALPFLRSVQVLSMLLCCTLYAVYSLGNDLDAECSF